MKLTTFFISKTKQIYTKTFTVPERAFEIKAMLPWILFKILFTSAFICKQRLLHVNDIVQYPQYYKDVDHGLLINSLQTSTHAMKDDCPTTAHAFLTGPSILNFFLLLFNFQTALTKSIKLSF